VNWYCFIEFWFKSMKIMGLYTAYFVIMQKIGLLGHISVSNYAHMSI